MKTILVNENANAEEVVQTIADKMGIKNSEEFSLRQGGMFPYPLLSALFSLISPRLTKQNRQLAGFIPITEATDGRR